MFFPAAQSTVRHLLHLTKQHRAKSAQRHAIESLTAKSWSPPHRIHHFSSPEPRQRLCARQTRQTRAHIAHLKTRLTTEKIPRNSIPKTLRTDRATRRDASSSLADGLRMLSVPSVAFRARGYTKGRDRGGIWSVPDCAPVVGRRGCCCCCCQGC
jgi:hypothetical protein